MTLTSSNALLLVSDIPIDAISKVKPNLDSSVPIPSGQNGSFRNLSLCILNHQLFQAHLSEVASPSVITALTVIIDNEVEWRLRRETGNRVTPAVIAYIRDKTSYNKPYKAKELGNISVDDAALTAESDAVKFRGGGLIQLTGRYNYQRFVLPLLKRELGVRQLNDISEAALTAFMNEKRYAVQIALAYLSSRLGDLKKKHSYRSIMKAVPYLSSPKRKNLLELDQAIARAEYLALQTDSPTGVEPAIVRNPLTGSARVENPLPPPLSDSEPVRLGVRSTTFFKP